MIMGFLTSSVIAVVMLASSVSVNVDQKINTSNTVTTRSQVRVSTASREEFQERVKTIKSERKQKVLVNLDQRFTSVNEKWIEHWGNILDRLESILDKVGDKADTTDARSKIAEAREVIINHKDENYIITITDENNLGQDVQSLISQFKEDLSEIRSSVKSARDSVHSVLVSMRD